MKKIYILHEYDAKSHFFALYDYYKNNETIIIEDFIIISHKNLLKKYIKKVLKEKKMSVVFRYFKDLNKIFKIKKIKNSNLIVGIAPYSKKMKKYENIFKKNNSIYFTSFTDWDDPYANVHSSMKREEYLKILNESFKSVACVSKYTKEKIKPLIKNMKLVQVRHSVDIRSYKKKNLENKIIEIKKSKFLFIGNLIERKRVDFLIEWIKFSKEEFTIDFAGRGKLKESLKEIEKRDKRVKVLNFLKKSQIKLMLKDYDYLILPSKEELYGIVLIEALAAGVPCIVADAIGPKEIIKNNYNGIVINKDISIEKFDLTIKQAMNLSNLKYDVMSKNSLLEAKKYDSNSLIKEWNKILL